MGSGGLFTPRSGRTAQKLKRLQRLYLKPLYDKSGCLRSVVRLFQTGGPTTLKAQNALATRDHTQKPILTK